jgi:hypothetical protein
MRGGQGMTEAEWLACCDPAAMLDLLRAAGHLTERPLRLFACAACRRVSDRFHDTHILAAVEVAERHSDGLAGTSDMEAASRALLNVPGALNDIRDLDQRGDWQGKVRHGVTQAAVRAIDVIHWRLHLPLAARYAAAVRYNERTGDAQALEKERAAQAGLLRDVFGNPFRPVRVDAAWLTGTVVSLAQAAYDDRRLPSGELAPVRLAVLADALEDAGCTDDAILSHLRSPGSHVRGCWALNLILGKQ